VREGARVYLTDIETAPGNALARGIGKRAAFKRLDVREEQDWIRVIAEVIALHRRLDVVVNNAGITGFESGAVVHDPENTSLEDWRFQPPCGSVCATPCSVADRAIAVRYSPRRICAKLNTSSVPNPAAGL
jgi:NAD(P)-dependent dehydrogenase (short-subunit alcohol dehydrogenase family)